MILYSQLNSRSEYNSANAEYKDFISGKITAPPEGEDSAEWTSDAGRGYTIMITPSLYHRTGAVEVIDII